MSHNAKGEGIKALDLRSITAKSRGKRIIIIKKKTTHGLRGGEK